MNYELIIMNYLVIPVKNEVFILSYLTFVCASVELRL